MSQAGYIAGSHGDFLTVGFSDARCDHPQLAAVAERVAQRGSAALCYLLNFPLDILPEGE